MSATAASTVAATQRRTRVAGVFTMWMVISVLFLVARFEHMFVERMFYF